MKKIAFYHHGCDKNKIDLENAIGILTSAGYSVVSDVNDSDIVVVNTCSFINDAKQESVDTIVSLEDLGKPLIIMGCLPQLYGSEIIDEIPSIKGLVGTGNISSIVDVVKSVEVGEVSVEIDTKPSWLLDETTPRHIDKNTASAFVKISEGCNYHCSFCIIPKLRGKQRSRPIKSIVKEVESLASKGVKEVVLVAQNTTTYGSDIYGEPSLNKLLIELGKTSIPWVRLHYLYPTGLTTEIIKTMRDTENILEYFDIPLQHSHQDILKAMNRPYHASHVEGVLKQIREIIPEAAIRTTFIVGYPGEKREHFSHLIKFIKHYEFDHLGAFVFSPEEGTKAYELSEKVTRQTAQRRFDKLMTSQQEISLKRNSLGVGTQIDVLIEKECLDLEKGDFVGRSKRFAPDVDGLVYVRGEASVGEIVRVEIVEADVYDQYGNIKKP